jgi:hypothetical protein
LKKFNQFLINESTSSPLRLGARDSSDIYIGGYSEKMSKYINDIFTNFTELDNMISCTSLFYDVNKNEFFKSPYKIGLNSICTIIEYKITINPEDVKKSLALLSKIYSILEKKFGEDNVELYDASKPTSVLNPKNGAIVIHTKKEYNATLEDIMLKKFNGENLEVIGYSLVYITRPNGADSWGETAGYFDILTLCRAISYAG